MMTLNEAVKLLEPLQGKSDTNMLMRYSVGTIKSAIRTVFNRESATKDQVLMASCIEAVILKHQYRER